MTQPGKKPHKRDSYPGSSALEADALTTRPMRLVRSRVQSEEKNVCKLLNKFRRTQMEKIVNCFAESESPAKNPDTENVKRVTNDET